MVALSIMLLGVTAFILDFILSPGPRRFSIEHFTPTILAIGSDSAIKIQLTCAGLGRRPLRIEYLLDLDPLLAPQPTQFAKLPKEGMELTVPLVPTQRGVARVDALWLRWKGPFGLASSSTMIPLGDELRVIPNIAGVKQAAIQWFRNRELAVGSRVTQFRAEGSEFDALREFAPGHDMRSIDWNASARLRKLLVREFRAERNHQIVVAFDCGQLMREPIHGMPRLDHAIHAGLLLSYASLKTGDRIGMYAFADKAVRWIPPSSGMQTVTRMEAESAQLEYFPVETNFTASLTSLYANLKRRTLVVLFTEFWDSITAELMVENLGRLGKRHLVVCVTLKDEGLERIRNAPIESRADLERILIVDELAQERLEVLQRLKNLGVHLVTSTVDTVSGDVISEYLRIHHRELL
jgi:uncharacterized protein (DUF58 family)